MSEDLLIIKLRDCFTAGYTLPQFCIDNNIKKPLFIAVDERRADFLWEIYVQFKYDMKITPKFSLLNGITTSLNFSVLGTLTEIKFEPPAEINWNEYDAIIVLNAIRFNIQIPNIVYIDQLTDYFIVRTYIEIPLLHFMQNHKDVKLILTNFPQPEHYEGGKEFNDQLYDIKDLREKDIELSKNPFEKFGYTQEEITAILAPWETKINPDGSAYLYDNDHPLVRIENGRRATAYQPEKYKNKIYIIGPSHHLGAGAPFNKTIASYLQKFLNDNNFPYRVENESQYCHSRFQHAFYNLSRLTLNSGDVIIAYFGNSIFRPSKFPFCDISHAFDPPYDYKKIFAFKNHVNEIGFRIVAEKYFQFLVQNNFFKNTKIEYPAPPDASSLRYSERKFFFCNKTFRLKGIGGAQKISSRTAP